MQTETIRIVTTKEKFFLEYLTLKKPVIDSVLTKLNKQKTTLSGTPMKVLAQLLYYNDFYKDEQDDDKRWAMVFSKNTRISIRDKLDLKEHYFNNYLTTLRSLKIIDGNKIRKLFIVYANDDRELNFTFRINGRK